MSEFEATISVTEVVHLGDHGERVARTAVTGYGQSEYAAVKDLLERATNAGLFGTSTDFRHLRFEEISGPPARKRSE